MARAEPNNWSPALSNKVKPIQLGGWISGSIECGSLKRSVRFAIQDPVRLAWNQPIATMTIPALISTVAAMVIAVSSAVMIIQSLRMLLPSGRRPSEDNGEIWGAARLLWTSPSDAFVALYFRFICNRLNYPVEGACGT